MSEVIVYLSEELQNNLDADALSKRIASDLKTYDNVETQVGVSKVICSGTEASIVFSGFSAECAEDAESIINDAVNALVLHFGEGLDRKTVSVTMHCVITYELEVVAE